MIDEPSQYREIVDKLDLGIIILDEKLRVNFFNRWMYSCTGLHPDQVQEQSVLELFPELKGSRFESACEDAICLGLPATLSNSFNSAPLPLYNKSYIGNELYRLQQNIMIKPARLGDIKKICEVHIHDVSAMVGKEVLLKRLVEERALEAQQKEAARKRLAVIFNSTVDAIITFSDDHIIQLSNTAAQNLFAYSEEELKGKHFESLFCSEDDNGNYIADKLSILLRNAQKNARSFNTKAMNQLGDEVPVNVRLGSTLLDNKKLLVAAIRDCSQELKAQQILRDSEDRFRTLASIAPVGIFQTDEHGILTYVNDTWSRITGKFQENLHHSLWYDHADLKNQQSIGSNWNIKRNRKQGFSIEYSLQNGTKKIWVLCKLMRAKGHHYGATQYVGTITDISEQRESKDRIEHLAFFDPLTSLANRRLFKDRLQSALTQTQRSQQKLALFNLDIDHFKRINDSLGHDVGDALLHALASKLVECVRGEDTVARLGGDEFAILMTHLSTTADAVSIARKILQAISDPIEIMGHKLRVSTSIGISMAPHDGTDPVVLMKNADIAMYNVKDRGRNNYRFFTEDMNKKASNRLKLETELTSAIEKKEFSLFYQPKVDLLNQRWLGMEALIRWHHPSRGLVMPDDFIEIAEQSDFIIPIGEFVVHQACRQTQKLLENNGLSRNLSVAVNLSPKQFLDPKLPKMVETALNTAGLDPSQIELEITENLLMDNIDEALTLLRCLKDMGVRIAIDDFGTGYSSLAYLKQLPVDVLKIDRSFIIDICTNKQDKDIVSAVIAMAHKLGMQVVAEGIEHQDQELILQQFGCDIGQGYLYGKPVPIDQLAINLMTNSPPLSKDNNHTKLLN